MSGGIYYCLTLDKLVVPCTINQWCEMFHDRPARCVQQDVVDAYWVSTMFIGLVLDPDRVDVFETMVFARDPVTWRVNWGEELACRRTASWADAMRVHRAACRWACRHRQPLLKGAQPWPGSLSAA